MAPSTMVGLEKFLIPREEIRLATQNFSRQISVDVYRGEMKNRTVTIRCCYYHGGDAVFCPEVEILSTFHHQNIIPFIGYGHEGNHRSIVSEYAVNGSLEQHLKDPDKIRSLTWTHRLEICIGAAKGLEYLHSGLAGEDKIVIHKDVKSANILLDDNLEAKIGHLRWSELVRPDYPQAYQNDTIRTGYYVDPVFQETRFVTTGSDVYSFGVVLFEMLSGMLARDQRSIDGDDPQALINLVRRYCKDGLHNLIDPHIRDQISMRSFNVFKETAYGCISWNLRERPTMGMIVKRLQEALDVQNHRASSTFTMQSLQNEDLTSFLIPRNDLMTRGMVFKKGASGNYFYKRLDGDPFKPNTLKLEEFITKAKIMSILNHENIIRFIGYSDKYHQMFIVTQLATNRSLYYHLFNSKIDKSSCLTWAQRLKIGIGAARGLEYLHSGLGENRVVIHRNLNCTRILLDENMEAKIFSFLRSLLVNRNEPQVYNINYPDGAEYYTDPLYKESGMANTGCDVYSFGIVLFEMLCRIRACDECSIDGGQKLRFINLVKHYYDDGLEKLIHPFIRDQVNIQSLYTFKKIAYRCISMNANDRPTMKRIVKRLEEALYFQNHGTAYNITTQSLESYRIPLHEINLATGNFNPHSRIGEGGFGVVYKGQLSQTWQNCTVAIKRLNPNSRQGKKEFRAELNLISKFHHPNIIPFVGYCDEEDQMIIVYQYAVNRSLDYYLVDRDKRPSLTWAQRLNICLGAAKGLDYLHLGLGKHHRVIHRDIKSGNILLDEHLEAKICDFGLSTVGLGNQEISQIFTKVAGTNFYMDPIYYGSGILRKESDIYSFGVVLFEMLSGRPAYHQIDFVDGSPQHLINLVRYYYENGPEKLIDPDIRDQIDSRSFHTFREIAYQCISFISKERPTMNRIIDKIEDAIEFQELERDDALKEVEPQKVALSDLEKQIKELQVTDNSCELKSMDIGSTMTTPSKHKSKSKKKRKSKKNANHA